MEFRLLCGDEVGLFKSVGIGKGWGLKTPADAAANGKVLGRFGAVDREKSIDSLAWAAENRWDAGVVAVRADGSVKVLKDFGPKKDECKAEVALHDTGDEFAGLNLDGMPCVGLESFGGRLFTCSAMGKCQVTSFDPFAEPGQAFKGGVIKSFEVGENVSKMRRNPYSGYFSTGGKQNLLTVWDFETEKQLFKARNVPVNFLDMEMPVWVTDMCYFPVVDTGKGSKLSINGFKPEIIATCTAYSEVRVYDTRAKRRPVKDGYFGSARDTRRTNVSAQSEHMNCIVADTPDTVIVGNCAGEVTRVDLRTMKVCGRFKTFAGSVRSITKHPTKPFIASASMDRHVRVHHTETRKVVASVYLKQRMKCVLFCPDSLDMNPADLIDPADEGDVVEAFDEEDAVDDSGSDQEVPQEEDFVTVILPEDEERKQRKKAKKKAKRKAVQEALAAKEEQPPQTKKRTPVSLKKSPPPTMQKKLKK